MVATTALVEVLTTDTEFELLLATYTLLPSGVKASPLGPVPMGIAVETVLVVVFITETVFWPELAQ